jgi:hypothetical protein
LGKTTLVSFLGFFFCSTGDETQSFMLARQVLYHFSHSTTPAKKDYLGMLGMLLEK